MAKWETHSEYIASFPLPIRRKLKELQALIREEAPEAEEVIRYGVAAFHLEGPLVYIAGFKNHVSFFPTSSGIRAFRSELADYKVSTGTIQFKLDDRLPIQLLRKIVRFRLAEIRAKREDRSRCDKPQLADFDYSKLSTEFSTLPKPAQRALIQAGLFTPAKVAKKTESELLSLHGFGPSALPRVRQLLAAHALKLKRGR